MTKKSSARQMRDAAKKNQEPNKCWDDLIEVQRNMAQLLVQHTAIAAILRDADLMFYIEDKSTFINNVKLLSKDLVDMNDELRQLHDLHKDKTGGSTEPDEVIHSIGILEQYHLFMQRHEAVIMPTALHITEQIGVAEERRNVALSALKEAEGLTPLTDAQKPVVIEDLVHRAKGAVTDLEFKETTVQ